MVNENKTKIDGILKLIEECKQLEKEKKKMTRENQKVKKKLRDVESLWNKLNNN